MVNSITSDNLWCYMLASMGIEDKTDENMAEEMAQERGH